LNIIKICCVCYSELSTPLKISILTINIEILSSFRSKIEKNLVNKITIHLFISPVDAIEGTVDQIPKRCSSIIFLKALPEQKKKKLNWEFSEFNYL